MAPRLVTLLVSAALALTVVGWVFLHPTTVGGQGANEKAGTLGPSALDLLTSSGGWVPSERELDTADGRLTQRCMAASGFVYPLTPPVSTGDAGDDPNQVDLAARRRSGYGIARQVAHPQGVPSTGMDRYVTHLTPEQRARFLHTLFGAPGDRVTVDLLDGVQVTLASRGCAAESLRELGGDLTTWARFTYVPSQLNNRLADQVATTASYTAAIHRWSVCMGDRGLPFGTPTDARTHLRARLATEGATPALQRAEILIATSDAECAAQARVPSAALHARRELARTLPAAQRELLITLSAQRDAALHRARKILAG